MTPSMAAVAAIRSTAIMAGKRPTRAWETRGPICSAADRVVTISSADRANDTIYARMDAVPSLEEWNSLHIIDGGPGLDKIWGDHGDDVIRGGSGDDLIHALEGNNTVEGGLGNDEIDSLEGNDTIYGYLQSDPQDAGGNIEQGDKDIIRSGAGHDTIYGGPCDDKIVAGSGSDDIYGGRGDDILLAGNSVGGQQAEESSTHSIDAGSGNDKVYGDWGVDVIVTGEGNDQVYAYDGRDTITTGNGDDLVYAGPGDDWCDLGSGNDTFHGGGDNDIAYGREGNDNLNGGAGDDWLEGGVGNDQLVGDEDRDVLWGGTPPTGITRETFFHFVKPPLWDILEASDLCRTGWSADSPEVLQIVPSFLANKSYGGSSNDGADTLRGGPQGDWLFGGGGSDLLHGEEGE